MLIAFAVFFAIIGIVRSESGRQGELESSQQIPVANSQAEVLGSSQDRIDAPVPSAAAQTGPQTFLVASPSDWTAATQNARPGDTIRLTATINQPLTYRGTSDGSGTAASGTAEQPITITADPGVWIDPGDTSNGKVGLDVIYADHIWVDGVSIRNSQFGLRLIQVEGSAASPVRISNNTVTLTGHSGIIVTGKIETSMSSHYILVENNVVSDTGQTAPVFGEGIYIGYGRTEWLDESSDVVIRGNDISRTGSEGIDIKTGTRNILVQGNRIHDLAPINGGAISAHYSSGAVNPKPDEADTITIVDNLIWNQNLDRVPGANDWAIWVGHGGVEISRNRIWGLSGDGNRARAVRVRSFSDFGPYPITITDNIFWTAQGWVAEGTPSGEGLVQASGNIGAVAAGGTTVVDASYFPGSVPALGEASTADSGSGPGSAFGEEPTSPQQPAEDAAASNPTPELDSDESAAPPTPAAQVPEQNNAAPAAAAPAQQSTELASGSTASGQIADTQSGLVIVTPTSPSDASEAGTVPTALVDSGAATITSPQPDQSVVDDAPPALAFVEGPAEPGDGMSIPFGWIVGIAIAAISAAAGSVLLRLRSFRRS